MELLEWYASLPMPIRIMAAIPVILGIAMWLGTAYLWYQVRKLLPVLLIAVASQADARQLIQLEELYMSGASMNPASRDPLAPQYTGYWESRAALKMKFNVLGALYWDNDVHTEAADGAPKTVGWHWVLGVRVNPQIDLFEEHHSRHLMDEASPTERMYPDYRTHHTFPVEDSYGVRFNIYLGTKGESLWH